MLVSDEGRGCGESRAVMKEVSHAATYNQEKLDDLRLMVIYRNTEKTLANALGATEETSIFCYYHSVSYRYLGRFRGQNILSSFSHLVSIRPEELPLKSLNTKEDIETFFDSTDKAVLLLDFCGWTPKLMSRRQNNSYTTCGNIFGVHDASDNGSFTEFCTFEEFGRFESFFSKFTTFAREFFLPFERQRFGVVSERSLLSSLGVGDPDSQLVMLYFSGCPNCSKLLKEGDDLKNAFHMHHPLVAELELDEHYLESALSANKPSIILFVDKSSESSNTRRKSKEALDMFRSFTRENLHYFQMSQQNTIIGRKSSAQVFQGRSGKSRSDPASPPRTKLSPLAHDRFKDKMSVMIINEGESFSLESQGNSIQDIFTYLLRQKKEAKLSLVAKKVGFQLLSNDLEIKLADLSLPQTKSSNSDDVSPDTPKESSVESGVNLKGNNLVNDVNDGVGVADELPVNDIGVAHYMTVEEKSVTQADKFEKQEVHHNYFKGAYFFSDGGYRLLRSLTASSKIPSLVIVDPVYERHYVFPEEAVLNYYSLLGFLEAFKNGTLISYQRSELGVVTPREATRPPFINFDFRDVDMIPQVTASSFSELVLGFRQSDSRKFFHAWNKDVLVLFSNNWCGFCQRMELVVHEVFRAFKSYMKTLKTGFEIDGSTFTADQMEDAATNELPLIFLMDCTLNDCHSLLNSMGQKELYPALMLYPAKRKTVVPYLGDMSMKNVIKFIADYGSNSYQLSVDNGILWNIKDGRYAHGDILQNASPSPDREEDNIVKETSDEVLLNKKESREAIKPNIHKSCPSNNLHEATHKVIVGSVLIATDKILNAPPFDKSTILIVQADEETGFRGLIINKHLSWDYFEGLMHLDIVKAPLSFGGPQREQLPLVSLARRVCANSYSEVFPSVYFLDNAATAKEIAEFKTGKSNVNNFWFFLGYSSWAWDQLYAEIAEGSWSLSENPEEQFNWP
ncbi:hypothetical protein GIB67_036009 [Kingdonia uniflora]|uniref:Thioredoxin domain-containing protein n=1 Tax=Kingdonia uniflora TaxID=39325 RepID=A0A7J7N1K2_9MAGN|nr:hypothetical protein GIB67_036009 [Kingdonia uniflora]